MESMIVVSETHDEYNIPISDPIGPFASEEAANNWLKSLGLQCLERSGRWYDGRVEYMVYTLIIRKPEEAASDIVAHAIFERLRR